MQDHKLYSTPRPALDAVVTRTPASDLGRYSGSGKQSEAQADLHSFFRRKRYTELCVQMEGNRRKGLS